MNYLSVENISKSFGERTLFKDISFGINKDQKIAFIAKNGSGKTSILRALLFFYNPEGQNQGISSNQKNFVDFYFPYPNSYIVFEVEKENSE